MFSPLSDETASLLAVRYLQYRPRSIKEVREYLKKKQTAEHVIDKIIQTLLDQKFLNDEEFARMWVRTRAALKPLSQRVLRMELQQKGITKETIDIVLSQQQEVSGNDLEMAKSLILKRRDRYKNVSKEELYRKLGGFLARRGFTYDVIKTGIDEIFHS